MVEGGNVPLRYVVLSGLVLVAFGCHDRKAVDFVNTSGKNVQARLVGEETSIWVSFGPGTKGGLTSVYQPESYHVEVRPKGGRSTFVPVEKTGETYIATYSGP